MEDWCRRPDKEEVTSDKEMVGKAEKGATNIPQPQCISICNLLGKWDCADTDTIKVTNFKISREIIPDYLGVPNLIHERLKAENFLQIEARDATEREVRDLKHKMDLMYLRHRGPCEGEERAFWS